MLQLSLLLVRLMSSWQLIVGRIWSTTVTVKMHSAVPQELVAVKVTVVTPLLNVEPLPVPLPDPEVAPEKLYETAGVGVPVAVAA